MAHSRASVEAREQRREANELVRELRRSGCEVGLTGGEHIGVRHPSGAALTFAATPNSWRLERAKVRAWLRRAEAGQAATTTRSGRRASDGAPAHAALARTYVTTGL